MLFILLLIITVVLGAATVVLGRRIRDLKAQNRLSSQAVTMRYVSIGGFTVFLMFCLMQWITVVDAGETGVVNTFGIVSESPLSSGINVVNPFAQIVPFSIKTQEIKEAMKLPTKEGLTVDVDVSLLYRLREAEVPVIYRTIGTNYKNVFIVPNFRSITRGVTSQYEAKDLYTSSREVIEQKLIDGMTKSLEERGMVVERVLLREVILPQQLADAITTKLQAEQESQKMEFVLTKEEMEAKRKAVEAEGIKNFQKIVSEGIDDKLLKWKGIEATKELALSNNTKIVIVSGDKLPIILGGAN